MSVRLFCFVASGGTRMKALLALVSIETKPPQKAKRPIQKPSPNILLTPSLSSEGVVRFIALHVLVDAFFLPPEAGHIFECE